MKNSIYQIIQERDFSAKLINEKLIKKEIITIMHNRITYIENLIWDREINNFAKDLRKEIDSKFDIIKLSKGDLIYRKHKLTHEIQMEFMENYIGSSYTKYLKLSWLQEFKIKWNKKQHKIQNIDFNLKTLTPLIISIIALIISILSYLNSMNKPS